VKKSRNREHLKQKSRRTQEHESYALVQLCSCAILSCAVLVFSGCNSGQRIAALQTKIKNLTSENDELNAQLDQLDTDNKELEKRIVVLQDLPDDVKGINLYDLVDVKIQNYSDLFDENDDGRLDTLIVRVQPIDSYGDIIKAAGNVDVELWNLNKPENQALIGKWHVGVKELKEDWVSAWGITNYRLSFDITDKIAKFDEPLTIKMNFTGYLSGRVFQAQKVIEP
jgi:outer membrane murein-binding lipoprotein Lpp